MAARWSSRSTSGDIVASSVVSASVFVASLPGVATPRFHRLLMLSVRLSRVPGIVLAIYIEVLAVIVLAVWSAQLDSLAVGFVVAAAFLIFAMIDWTALAQLPRRNRSYGPVAPTLLALAFAKGFGFAIGVFAALLVLAALALLLVRTETRDRAIG